MSVYCASNLIEVEVPENLSSDALRDYVEDKLNDHLPEVHKGSSFEYPMEGQIEGDEETFDLKG